MNETQSTKVIFTVSNEPEDPTDPDRVAFRHVHGGDAARRLRGAGTCARHWR